MTWFIRVTLWAELTDTKAGFFVEAAIWRSAMATIARVLSRTSGTDVDVETIKTCIMFCGVGLTVSLMLASYGLDLSPGFF